MTTYIALLRGINVGGNKKVEMKKLKQVFEDAGYTDVSTYINSGNIIFKSSADKDNLKISIEKLLHKKFGFEIKTIVLSSGQFKKIAATIAEKYSNDDKQKTDVLFLTDEFDAADSIKLIKLNPDVDNITYVKGALIWNIDRAHHAKSGLKKFIGTTLYKNMTARNVNTVRKLAGMV